MRVIALLLAVTIATAGCRLASNAPNPKWMTDFQTANALRLTKGKSQITVSDPQAIDRLRDIYATAKWKTYWHTLPETLRERTIELLDGESKLRQFSYTGTLWETESYTENRTAKLAESDRRFIESLFAELPDESGTPDGAE